MGSQYVADETIGGISESPVVLMAMRKREETILNSNTSLRVE
jgi:hypothetical protein